MTERFRDCPARQVWRLTLGDSRQACTQVLKKSAPVRVTKTPEPYACELDDCQLEDVRQPL